MENELANADLLEKALKAAQDTDGLGAADVILDGFGIEYVAVGGRELAYVNLGETYQPTICREGTGLCLYGKPFIGSWGDWYEAAETEYEANEDVIRCGYCSEFTPLQEGKDWSEIVCESCGNLVGS